MSAEPDVNWSERIEGIHREEGRSAFATLVRVLGDFDRAEDALQEAYRCALEAWPLNGMPDNPAAWLVAIGRNRALDTWRRQRRLTSDDSLETEANGPDASEPDEIADDRLRLVFTCCHPSLSLEARIALTLREVCGLSTEQIASAFLLPTATLAQRLVRAKAKIRTAGIPFAAPAPGELPQRLPSVLRVVYLVFNEGYSASSGEHVVQVDLAEEAIRLLRLLHSLLPEPEIGGLLALCLLQQSRAPARCDGDGDLVPLEEQDRRLWRRGPIDEGRALVEAALRSRRFGAYTLQAAIAAVHADAERAEDTDWTQIEALYGVLLGMQPQPVVALNRAVATAMRGDLQGGLREVEALAAGPLADYLYAHAARADLLRRAGHTEPARQAYRRALELARQAPERRLLQRRLDGLDAST